MFLILQCLRKWGGFGPPGFLRVSTFFEFCPLLNLEIEVQNYKPTDGMLSGPPWNFSLRRRCQVLFIFVHCVYILFENSLAD